MKSLPQLLFLFVGLLLLSPVTFGQSSLKNYNGIVALYNFNSNLKNSIKADNIPAKLSTGTKVSSNSLFVNGEYKDYETSFNLSSTLSPHKSFTFSYNFKPKAFDKEKYATTLISFGRWGRWLGLERYKDGHLSLTIRNSELFYDFEKVKIDEDKWYNVVFSYDASQNSCEIYLNGRSLQKINLGSLELSKRKGFDLSFCNYGNGNVFNGQIAKMVFLNRFLPKSELSNFYRLMIADVPARLATTPHDVSEHQIGDFRYEIDDEWDILPMCVEGDKGKSVEVICSNKRRQAFNIHYKEREKEYVILRNSFSSIGGYKFSNFDDCLKKLLEVAKKDCN